jgi:hypothetical protein
VHSPLSAKRNRLAKLVLAEVRVQSERAAAAKSRHELAGCFALD